MLSGVPDCCRTVLKNPIIPNPKLLIESVVLTHASVVRSSARLVLNVAVSVCSKATDGLGSILEPLTFKSSLIVASPALLRSVLKLQYTVQRHSPKAVASVEPLGQPPKY